MPTDSRGQIRGLKKELEILRETAQLISSSIEINDVLGKITSLAAELTKADSCLIYLCDRKTGELVLRASRQAHQDELGKVRLKVGEGITGAVAREKKPIAISSGAYTDARFKSFVNLPEDRYEAFLSIPILSKDEVIGVINIQHRKKHIYKESLTNLLFTVARYLGSAIENSLTYEEVKKRAKRIELLSDVSRAVVSDRYLEEILHLIVTMTAEVMDSKICSIMLLNEEKEELVIAATQSLSGLYRSKPNIKAGQSVSGRALKEKKAVTVTDVVEEPGYMYPEIAKKEGIVSLLCVPMMIKERAVGVINSYTAKRHEFSEEEIAILQAVANQAATAIENTRINREIVAVRETLESRKTIERAKGMLMKKLGITEEEAYNRLRKKSMDIRKSLREVADAVIVAFDMEGKLPLDS